MRCCRARSANQRPSLSRIDGSLSRPERGWWRAASLARIARVAATLLARTSHTTTNTMSAARCVGAMAARPVALAGASRAGRARVAGVAPARGLGGPGLPARRARRALAARADAAPDDSSATSATSAPKDETRISVDDVMMDSTALPANFCIIEGGARDKVRDFADMGVDELLNNIESRKNKVFIMLEEVRRLRVQVQLKNKTEEVRENTFGFEPATRARDGDVAARREPSRSPVPRSMARLMLSAGMLAALAADTAARKRGFPSGSPPPSRAATVISRMILVKSLPRLASARPFLCLMVLHLLCPDMYPVCRIYVLYRKSDLQYLTNLPPGCSMV